MFTVRTFFIFDLVLLLVGSAVGNL